jgi:hypothetical protein
MFCFISSWPTPVYPTNSSCAGNCGSCGSAQPGCGTGANKCSSVGGCGSCNKDDCDDREITLDLNIGAEPPPKDNNNRKKCYWCKDPTVKKTLFSSSYDFCERCKK